MTIQEAASFLRHHDRYLILTHVRPDGDTLGCAAALCRSLREAGKSAYLLPNEQTSALFRDYVQGLDAGEDYQPETVVSVDIASRSLFPDNAQCYRDRVDLAIDHHPSQEFFARETILDPSSAACGELLYEILRLLGPIRPESAAALYVAVSTDCGCFAYGNTTARTHRIAAELIDLGAPAARLNKKHFRTKSMTRLRLESALIADMELYDGGEIALVTLPLSLMERLGATEEDAEDISSLAGATEGVKIAVTLREQNPQRCKLSLRTDPEYLNANLACAKLGGGGHAAAGGCVVDADIAGTKRAILEAIAQVRGKGGPCQRD